MDTINPRESAGYGQKGVRDIPIDPLLREALLKIGPGAPEDRGALRVTSATTNMRKMLLTAVLRAGLKPWPRLFQNLRASCEMDWADWAGHHAAAAWIGHSLAISAKHYVRVRGDHFEKVTGRLIHNAIHDALTTQFTTQHVPAPACNNPQQMLRGPVKGRVVHLGADPCGYMLETSMGDTGLRISRDSNLKSRSEYSKGAGLVISDIRIGGFGGDHCRRGLERPCRQYLTQHA